MKEENILLGNKFTLTFIDSIFVESYNVKLKFKKPIHFHFYHGSKLFSFISNILEYHPLPQDKKKVNDIVIYPCESSRIFYKPGDEYNFQITFLRNDQKIIRNFFSNLANIPEFEFGGDLNKDSVELIDIFKIPDYTAYEPLGGNEFTLKFITPLRMERKEEDKKKGKTLFDLEYFDCKHFFKLLYKRIADLYKLNCGTYPSNEIPDNPEAEILDKYFIWIDVPKENNKITLGGMIGYIKFRTELEELWKRILWFGQITHVGKNSSAGFGKYLIEGYNHKTLIPKPSKNYLQLVVNKENLLNAFIHIKNNSDIAGIDGITPDIFELNLEQNINNLIEEIKSGQYKASDLQGIIIPKANNKIRALAIPTVKDRILQRAVVQIIGDSIDHLLEENSYAYRKGLSRKGAALAINEARKHGYNYILESDIQSFFDNVDWELLFKKIEILFDNDPISEFLLSWIKSDVIFNGIKIKRTKGLPQGAVISPLLANLFLDEFDEALQDNFKLVRYADDFVILCKSKEQAENALIEVKKTLENLKLEIKPSKTRIISFDEGFQYLGYLFLKSLIIEKNDERKENILDYEITPESIPEGSWLTLVDLEKLKSLHKTDLQEITPLKKNEVQEILLEKFPLYVTGNSYIHIDEENINIINDDEPDVVPIKYPLQDIVSVVIIGNSRISMPAIFKLNENNIPIYFCRPNGELKLSIPLNNPDFNLWTNQLTLANDYDFTLKFAREVVKAKINNHKVIARRVNEENDYKERFNSLIEKAKISDSLDSLRGIEGSSASLFYEVLNNSIPDEWKFDRRNKRPPKDPVNTMLSFGYSILYHHISTAILLEGINPQIGFYHKPSNRYYPLASDLQEEFRHIIDSLVLYIIRRNMVTRKDFIFEDSNYYPCFMTKDFRKKFISMVEERLKVEFTPPNFSKKITYKEFIVFQVKVLKFSIQKKEMKYQPLWIR